MSLNHDSVIGLIAGGGALVVLGATLQPLLSQAYSESIPESVAKACRKPLVMVKASGGLRSWVKRWI